MLDIMEDTEVVVYQEQEQVSSEEQGQEHPRPGAPSDRPALEALVALQLELDPVNKKAQRAHARLKHKNCQRRRVHLEHRSAIIQGIPGFWVEVVSLGVVLVNCFFKPGLLQEQFTDLAVLVQNLLFWMMGIGYCPAYLFLKAGVMS